ncbi:hypothetical protein [Roseivirga thermotolerans]|uniref:hypothetical protein n=1 Tax=Roseivirga thermotolerans TaxID=1758176 RepID=UPI00273F7CB3|nr:hypothetical protein [Roseivirga thermotolerans]
MSIDKMFGENNFRFGVESFLFMSLDHFQIVQAKELESFEARNPDSLDYNLYFIIQRPKVRVDPNSFKSNHKVASLNLIVENGETHHECILSFEIPKAQTKLKIQTKYPYETFVIGDEIQPFLIANAGIIIDEAEWNDIVTTHLDYEILYIGQAFGKEGNRLAHQRLSNHSTLIKILSDINKYSPHMEAHFMFVEFKYSNALSSAAQDLIKVSKPNRIIQDKKIQDFFSDQRILNDRKTLINITEAALIKYFQPRYNSNFKDTFPSSAHKSYQNLYEKDIKSIYLEIELDHLRKIYTKKVCREVRHFSQFQINKDRDRYDLFQFS